MPLAATLLPEFDQEMAATRRVLERIPDDKFGWQAHPRSHTIGWNANHVVDIPGWTVMVLTTSEFDIAPVGGEAHATPTLATARELLGLFDRNVAAAREALAAATDEALGQPWTLASGGHPVFTIERAAMIRSYILNHVIHHRAHLCVYLRLNDLPVPGMYGPSGDE